MLIQKQCNKLVFTGNLGGANNRVIFFIIEETKETKLHFSDEKSIVNLFYFNTLLIQNDTV